MSPREGGGGEVGLETVGPQFRVVRCGVHEGLTLVCGHKYTHSARVVMELC